MFLKRFSLSISKLSLYKSLPPIAFFSQSHSIRRKTSNFQDNSSYLDNEKQRITTIEKDLKAFNEFKEGVAFQEQGKHKIAEERFRRVLDIMEMSPLKGSDSHLYLLRKLSNNQLFVKDYKATEKYLQSILEIVKTTKDQEQKNSYMDHLLQVYLRLDANKVISLAKELLNDQNKAKLPKLYQTRFLFDLGTAHLLNGDFNEAIKVLNECIELEPENLLKGYALNNLGLAVWWQNKPASDANKTETNQDTSKFEEAISLFKDAIYNIENVSGLQGDNKNLFEELLSIETLTPKDATKLDPDAQMIITKKESLNPLLNIVKCLYEVLPDKKKEGAFWARYAIKAFEKHNSDEVYRILIALANFYANTKAFIKSEGLFRRSLELLENKNTYEKVMCLDLYGQMLTNVTNRRSEGEKILEDAKIAGKDYPAGSERLVSVCLPETEF